MDALIKAHLIDDATGTMISKRRVGGCPRIGDEIRLSDDQFFTVVRVVWCLDESMTEGQRVNIGVKVAA